MPALVKSNVGSSPGTSGALGTTRWPFLSKYFKKDDRISLEVIRNHSTTKDTRDTKGRSPDRWSATDVDILLAHMQSDGPATKDRDVFDLALDPYVLASCRHPSRK